MSRNSEGIEKSLTGNDKPLQPVFDITDYVDIVAIDTETTGLDPDKHEIIEVAAVKQTKNQKQIVYSSLIKPLGEVPHYIEYLTGITSEELENAPFAAKVLKEVKDFIGNAVLIGQNTRFDYDFINAGLIHSNQLPLTNQWWDTAELGRIYLPFISNHKLGTMCNEMGIELEHAHRAIHDAKATSELMDKLLDYILSHTSVTVNARVLELSRQAMLDSNLTQLMEMIVDFQRKFSLIIPKPSSATVPLNNILEHKFLQPKLHQPDEFFAPDGLLQRNFSQYEYRAGQLEMAWRTSEAFEQGSYLLIEAGTGVGKSFAYLIPALQFANRHGKRVIVSTNTKNLQEQLFQKDLPLLKNVLQIPFKAVLVKGRENYVCERKWEELMMEQARGLTPFEASAMLYLLIWRLQTNTGDITENSSFDRSRFGMVWRRIGSDRHYCAGRKCSHFNQCFVMRLRKNVEDASLIVINHSLLLADLMSDHVSLGNYEHLIIDEAHNIMQTASRQLGIELNYAEISNQLNQVSRLSRKKNTAFIDQIRKAVNKSVLGDTAKQHIAVVCASLEEIIETNRKPVLALFECIARICETHGSYGKLRIRSTDDWPELNTHLESIVNFWKDLLKQLHALSNIFSGLNSKQIASYDSLMERVQGMEMRADETEHDLLCLLNPDFEKYAFWLETPLKQDRQFPTVNLCCAPIEVNQHLNNLIYKTVPCIIFTSATLALRNSFKYFKHQAGIDLIEDKTITEHVVESPFDYAAQSRLVVSGFLPEPGSDDKHFLPQALDLIEMVLESTPVGTLTLFTSYSDLDAAYKKLNDKLYQKRRPLFAQGKWNSRSALLDEFKKHNNAVLLGTSSFWEGIDVQGESLSLLILFKLPFQVPSEPVVEAYIEKLDKEKKNSFMHYMLPNALLKLRQGFGRLIRSKTDTGVVIIIDSRVATKFYGHFFREVLPATCRIMNDPLQLQSSVIDFFRHRHSFYK